jgi:futalosine hydrolase
MSILICAATEGEISPAREWVQSQDIQNISFCITGVGLVAATYALSKAIMDQRPALVIQAGIAGSLDQSLPIGTVRAVRHEIIGDLGVEENGSFRSFISLALQEADKFPFSGGKLSANGELISTSELEAEDAVSVNEISTLTTRLEYYKTLGAKMESMEGAALHYVALMENVPFLQVRAISNMAGERDKSKWNIEVALSNLNDHLIRLIKKFAL